MTDSVGFVWSLNVGGCIVQKPLVRPDEMPPGSWVRFTAIPFSDSQGECNYRVTQFERIKEQLPTRNTNGFLEVRTSSYVFSGPKDGPTWMSKN
jgi:hypothetical protein